MKKRKPDIEIGHYRGSRYWGVWVNSELLAVVCYRKGAEAIRSALLNRQQLNRETDLSGRYSCIPCITPRSPACPV